jgi:prevent-host-death family protein
MRISIAEAKGQLTELVQRVEEGEEVILTRDGQPAAQLVAATKKKPLTPAERRRILEEISAEGATKVTPGPSAARSQDFLYDEYGLPK